MMRRARNAAVVLLAAAGLVLAAGPAQAADPAGSKVCNSACDGKDPATSTGDRLTVSASLYGRTFSVHVDSGEQMAWATVTGGHGGDEVWIDRSFDAGKTWTGTLGRTAVPGGGTGWRTGTYNVDDWADRGIGAVRACGKAGDRPEVSCTSWTRTRWNAGDRTSAAATALMMGFDRGTKRFDGNAWWTGANALTALVDTSLRTGSRSYDYAIAQTYDANVDAFEGQFRNDHLDDTGWWGLAWVKAYDRTGDSRYLSTARADADHVQAYWDGTCGGGVWWNESRSYKNAITNSLFVQLNAEPAQRTGDGAYRSRAQAGWDWSSRSGMIDGDGLVDALVQLHGLTGDPGQLATARRVGDAMVSRLSPGGILREPGESDSCSGDGASFKGAAIRGLGELNDATGGAHGAYLRRNADTAWANDRDSIDRYGSHWAGPRTGSNHSCQHSALDLLNTVR